MSTTFLFFFLFSVFFFSFLFIHFVFFFFFFFFNDTATTEIYTLSLHDALPISFSRTADCAPVELFWRPFAPTRVYRSEEHTSELQSLTNLVCRLLLEKKKKKTYKHITNKK